MMMIYFSFVCLETFLARRWVLGGFRCVGVIIMIAVLGAAAADSNANSVEEQIHAESIFVEELVAHVFMQLYVLSFVIEVSKFANDEAEGLATDDDAMVGIGMSMQGTASFGRAHSDSDADVVVAHVDKDGPPESPGSDEPPPDVVGRW